MSYLVVENLHKRYEGPQGGLEALKGVGFTVPAGDFVAVRGPSGCGKSTLLHILGAMDRPSEGSVRLRGQELSSLTPDELATFRRRHVGFVFQSFNLLPTLTVAENVALPLTLDGKLESAARRRACALLDRVGLADRADYLPAQLSGGEMQRAAVARAVAAEPALVLADEPTGNLDSTNGEAVMELLADLNERSGLTILLATHSAEAARYARRTLELRDGRLQRVVEHDGLSAPV
ncbi:MAG: ABC transporter ATP-binding protein [Pirellulales bacterium]|nr:ABC transporter ATP-binding protein [Pirellulales bacterium]